MTAALAIRRCEGHAELDRAIEVAEFDASGSVKRSSYLFPPALKPKAAGGAGALHPERVVATSIGCGKAAKLFPPFAFQVAGNLAVQAQKR